MLICEYLLSLVDVVDYVDHSSVFPSRFFCVAVFQHSLVLLPELSLGRTYGFLQRKSAALQITSDSHVNKY